MSDHLCTVSGIRVVSGRSDMHHTDKNIRGSVSARRTAHRSASRRGSSLIELTIFGVLLFALIFAGYRAVKPGAAEFAGTEAHKVSESQTLWEIASAHRIDGMSTAETVEVIKSLNGLTDSSLRVGQVVEVPVDSSANTAMASR